MVTNRDRKSFGRVEKIPKLLRRLAPLMFMIRVQAFRDPLRGELWHVQIFINNGPIPLTWDAQLHSYSFSRNTRWSSKISSWIWPIISGVVTVLGRPGRGSSQVEKITKFKLCHPVFDGVIQWCMFPECFFQNFLRRLTLHEKKNLMTAGISLLKSRASPDMLPFSLCNKKRLAIRDMNRPIFPTTLSIPSYDIG